MNEFLASAKFSLMGASVIGSIISMAFIKMTPRKRFIAVLAGAAMAHYIGQPISAWVGLEPETTGFLIGLFGMSICSLIFDGIQKSDISVKFSDIAQLFRR